MADFPAMPLWTDAIIGDTTHLTTFEFGVYMKLLIAGWRTRRCCLPRSKKLLARYSGISMTQWDRIEDVILPFFHLRYRHGEHVLFQKKQRKVRSQVLKISRSQKKRRLSKSLKYKAAGATGVRPQTDQPKPKPVIEDSVTNVTEPEPGSLSKSVDPAKLVYDAGKSLLERYGISNGKAGALVTKWRRQADDARLLTIIADTGKAERADPVSYIAAAVQSRAPPSQSRKQPRSKVQEVLEARAREKWNR